MKKYKFDFIIIIFFVLVAVVSLVLFSKNKDEGGYVEVVVDKETKEIFPLDEEKEYTISDGKHINKIIISDGKVCITEANCPDKLCVKQGRIDKDGQSIICLPNKVVIKIVSDKNNNVDAVAK